MPLIPTHLPHKSRSLGLYGLSQEPLAHVLVCLVPVSSNSDVFNHFFFLFVALCGSLNLIHKTFPTTRGKRSICKSPHTNYAIPSYSLQMSSSIQPNVYISIFEYRLPQHVSPLRSYESQHKGPLVLVHPQ